ncbi:hypothetical protein BDW22DRAFT_1340460 [Trametopsis cervina]|nr:hypothetical protein BDW22DRAFT_1340460 [Trametopsis cervina]
MSIARQAIHRSVMPLFRLWHDAVGPTVAKQTRVCIIGGLYWDARGIRRTPDVDLFVKYDEDCDRFKIRDLVASRDDCFTASAESRCGVTYREKVDEAVITYDIVDERVTLYEPKGMTLADVVTQEVLPLPTDTEAIIMKLFSGPDCLKSRREKAVKDFDDAMKLLNVMGKQDSVVSYGDEAEKAMVKMAFDLFYPKYIEYKKALPEDSPDAFLWTEEEWKVYLKTSEIGKIVYKDDADKKMVEMAFNAFYPAFKKAQEDLGKEVMSEEEWKAFLQLD